jgi:putative flippase GtrA
MLQKNSSVIFVKAQLSSITATAIDFLFTHFFTESLGIWYVLSTSMGTIFGGFVNFSLGRYWVFNAKNNKKINQAKRYIVIWFGSLFLNTLGVFLFTELFHIHYLLSKLLVSITVSVSFNYYFQKSFVFKVKNEIIQS